jgi:hypothetical protein
MKETTVKKRFSGNKIEPPFSLQCLCPQRPRKIISSGLIY